MPFNGVPKRHIHTNLVPVTTALPDSSDISRLFQVRNDALNGAFGDSNAAGHIAHHNLRFPGDAKQHMRVIGKKRPPGIPQRPSASHPLFLWCFPNHCVNIRHRFHEFKSV